MPELHECATGLLLITLGGLNKGSVRAPLFDGKGALKMLQAAIIKCNVVLMSASGHKSGDRCLLSDALRHRGCVELRTSCLGLGDGGALRLFSCSWTQTTAFCMPICPYAVAVAAISPLCARQRHCRTHFM